jgi:hypothetical protein
VSAVLQRKGEPLNGHMPWWGPARAAVLVASDLRGKILALYDAHLSADGKVVDYNGLGQDSRFAEYTDSTTELQKVDLFQLSREGAWLLAVMCFLQGWKTKQRIQQGTPTMGLTEAHN